MSKKSREPDAAKLSLMTESPVGRRPGTTITRRFEMYMDAIFTKTDFESMKCLGFTQLFPNFQPYATVIESIGLDVVLPNWWDTSTAWSTVSGVLQFAEQLTDLVSINMMDEPELDDPAIHPPSLYHDLRREIRNAGFHQPLSLTIYGPDPNWPASLTRKFVDYLGAIDILRITSFPVAAGKPLRQVADWVNQARLLMEVIGREMPLTVVLQTWEDSAGTLPTIGQLRVMAYLAMFSGTDTLSFIDYNPQAWSTNPGFSDGFVVLMAELTGLAREFAGAEVYPILGPDGMFQVEVSLQGDWTNFIVNTLESPNGPLAPLEIVREKGRFPRPPLTADTFKDEPTHLRPRPLAEGY